MSEYKAIETTDLVKIANAIRLKKGGTDKISLEDMPAMIREIEGGGVKLPALTNEAAASELLAGKQLINDEGVVITGAMADNGTIASTMDGLNIKEVTIPAGYTSGGIVSLDNTIDNEVDIQADLLAQAVAALEGKAGGGSEPSLQSKSVTPSAVQQTVVPDSGYDGLDKVTVAAIPSTYVKPTATKAATTYTPTTSNQTIAAGTYCSGAQTIKGDANLVAGNIKSGVSIFGVAGSYEGSSSDGGDSGSEPTIVSGTTTISIPTSSAAATQTEVVTVKGLGFKPFCVMVRCRNTVEAETEGINFFISCQMASGVNPICARALRRTGYNYSAILTGGQMVAYIKFIEDGFTLCNGSFTNMYYPSELDYIAIG